MPENGIATMTDGPIVHRIGEGDGEILSGAMGVEVVSVKAKKGTATRATLKVAGSFVEFEPGSKTPKKDAKGEVRVIGSHILSEKEVAATLAAWGITTFTGEPKVAALASAAVAAGAAGRLFVLRLPATKVAAGAATKAILEKAKAYDPTA